MKNLNVTKMIYGKYRAWIMFNKKITTTEKVIEFAEGDTPEEASRNLKLKLKGGEK